MLTGVTYLLLKTEMARLRSELIRLEACRDVANVAEACATMRDDSEARSVAADDSVPATDSCTAMILHGESAGQHSHSRRYEWNMMEYDTRQRHAGKVVGNSTTEQIGHGYLADVCCARVATDWAPCATGPCKAAATWELTYGALDSI